MGINFVAQPEGETRTGDFLMQGFADTRWSEFRAAVAFVKRSGTKHVREALERFSKRGGIARIAAGIDAGGTSQEGLSDLMDALDGRGSVYVFKNAGVPTFHPKVYLFSNDDEAEVLVGSGNLTEGGLYTNYEASLMVRLDLADKSDASVFAAITATLDSWATPVTSLCYELNPTLLQQLASEGLVPDENRAWGDAKIAREGAAASGIFAVHQVPAAPKVSYLTHPAPALRGGEGQDADDDEGLEVVVLPPAPAQQGDHKVFLMTLHKTDVGVGQTTKGASRRSPEIFIPLRARDQDPNFWGWPAQFVEDPTWTGEVDGDGRGKMDRNGVMVRLGGATFPVNFFYNPVKRDMRLRSENIRSAGSIGDILYVERTDGSAGFSYYIEVVPQGVPRHDELLEFCVQRVPNSPRVFGYL